MSLRRPPADWGALADTCFALIERAALNGERCPTQGQIENIIGYGPSPAMKVLRERSWIRVWLGGRDWRTVEVLKGPAAGHFTAHNGSEVWAIVDHDGRRTLDDHERWWSTDEAPPA